MIKVKSIQFINHPILGNLYLDFCDNFGNVVDTIIIAGENGTGKSTVLREIDNVLRADAHYECDVNLLIGNVLRVIRYRMDKGSMHVYDEKGHKNYQGSSINMFRFNTVYSDVDINFAGGLIRTVASTDLDNDTKSIKSDSELATRVKQLIVDIQDADDADTAESLRKAKEKNLSITEITPGKRMERFTNAFNRMFDGLTYRRVLNQNNRKSIVFSKNGAEFDIDMLSSGEKQIVYRGCFMLKNVNSLKGATVFIDGPEISLHPEWQKKILDYYKNIFTDEHGDQASQLFVATHSPFVLHNEQRKNDKVIVLRQTRDGKIESVDKPEYYQCGTVAAVKDAFSELAFLDNNEGKIVYVEGRTDEAYLRKAYEIFGFKDNIEFKWIGHLNGNGGEEFTGKNSMDQARKFLLGHPPKSPRIFLYDNDTGKKQDISGNVIVMSMPYIREHDVMNKGIENVLELNEAFENLDGFYQTKTIVKDYGQVETIKEFQKMKLCEYICKELGKTSQQKVLIHLKDVIDVIVGIKGEIV